jgi:hypothetical protein
MTTPGTRYPKPPKKIRRFRDGSSLETTPDGTYVIREGGSKSAILQDTPPQYRVKK